MAYIYIYIYIYGMWGDVEHMWQYELVIPPKETGSVFIWHNRAPWCQNNSIMFLMTPRKTRNITITRLTVKYYRQSQSYNAIYQQRMYCFCPTTKNRKQVALSVTMRAKTAEAKSTELYSKSLTAKETLRRILLEVRFLSCTVGILHYILAYDLRGFDPLWISI